MPTIRLNSTNKTIKIVNRKDTIRLQQSGRVGPSGADGVDGIDGITPLVISNDPPASTEVLWVDSDDETNFYLPNGGIPGQVLTKLSNNDFDAEWETPPTSLTPTGAAGGDLGGTYPNPTVLFNNDTLHALKGDNSDITSLSGLTTPLSIAQGGTGSGTLDFVKLTGDQSIAGVKTFIDRIDVGGYGAPLLAVNPPLRLKSNVNGITGVEMTNTSTGTSADFRFMIFDSTGHYFTFSQATSAYAGTLFGYNRNTTNFIFSNQGTGRDMVIGPLTANELALGTNGVPRLVVKSTGSIQPSTNLIQSFGDPSFYWSNMYARRIDVNSTAYIHGNLAGQVAVVGSGGTYPFVVIGDQSTTNLLVKSSAAASLSNVVQFTAQASTLSGNSTVFTIAGKFVDISATVPTSRVDFNTVNAGANVNAMTILGNLIGVGTVSPTHTLTLGSTSTGKAEYNTIDQTTNYERVLSSWVSNIYTIQSGNGGTGIVRDIRIGTYGFPTGLTINATFNSKGHVQARIDTNAVNAQVFSVNGVLNASSGLQYTGVFAPTMSQTGTAGWTTLLINPTVTGGGSGIKLLIDGQVNGASLFRVDSTGAISTTSTNGVPLYITSSNQNTWFYLTNTRAADALNYSNIAFQANSSTTNQNTFTIVSRFSNITQATLTSAVMMSAWNNGVYGSVMSFFDNLIGVNRTLVPVTSLSVDLGGVSNYFSNVYSRRLVLNATAYLDGNTAGVSNLTGRLFVSESNALDTATPDTYAFTTTQAGGRIALGSNASGNYIQSFGTRPLVFNSIGNNSIFYGNVGIGSTLAAPTHSLTLGSTTTGVAWYNGSDQTTNYERAIAQWSGGAFSIRTAFGGTGIGRDLIIGSASTLITFKYDQTAAGSFQLSRGLSIPNTAHTSLTGTHIQSSGMVTHLSLTPIINQTSTAGYTVLLINPTETGTGSGPKNLIDAQVGGTSKFKVDNGGNVTANNVANTNAKNITVSSTTPTSPSVNDIWIVI